MNINNIDHEHAGRIAIITIISAIIVFIGLLVIYGWVFDILILKSISPSWISMKVNTAILFILCGIALYLLRRQPTRRIERYVSNLCLFLVLTISFLSLFQYTKGVNLRIDELFIKEVNVSPGTFSPGRMALITAVDFILISLSLLLINIKFLQQIINIVSLFVLYSAILCILHYLLPVDVHYLIVSLTRMSFYAAFAFILLSIGVLLVNPRQNILEVLFMKTAAGYFVRHTLPFVIIIPILVIILVNLAVKYGLFDHNYGDVIPLTVNIMTLSLMLMYMGLRLDRYEKKHAAVTKTLKQTQSVLNQITENVDFVFYHMSPDLSKMIYINPAFERIWGLSRESIYKDPKLWLSLIIPEDREHVQRIINTILNKKSHVTFEYRIKRANRELRTIFAYISPLIDDTGKLTDIVGIATDITDYSQAKKYIEMDNTINKILIKSTNIKELATNILQTICMALNWQVGEVWLQDKKTKLLNCLEIWHQPDVDITSFKKYTKELVLPENKGFQGLIQKERKPVWIENYMQHPEFVRAGMVDKFGILMAFGLPIFYKNELLGVIDFLSKDLPQPNAVTQSMLEQVAQQIGEFIAHEKRTKEVKYLINHDSLTGLLNRYALVKIIDEIILEKPMLMSVLMFDINRLSVINEALGHATGDVILRKIAKKLKRMQSKFRFITSRFNTDKFVIFFQSLESIERLMQYLYEIKTQINEPIFINNEPITITVSVGISTYPDDGTNAETLLNHADIALKKAKEEGGDNFQFYTNNLPHVVINNLKLERELRNAILNHEFCMYYQPQIDLKTGKLCGAEALLRWLHPVKGFIPPMTFLPMAERTCLIVPLSEWIIREVIQQTKGLLEKYYQQSGDIIPIAINISLQHFKQQYHLIDFLRGIIKEYALNAKFIEIEITESIFMQDTEQNLMVLDELSKMGIQFALDDFGTGFSSLSYLRRIPAKKIKIDKSFTHDLPNDPINASISRAVIAMTHSLGKLVIAEGVENEQQSRFLCENQCDIGQGYYFSKPLPFDEFKQFLNKVDMIV